MTGGIIMDTASHLGIRVGAMKQSCAEYFIAQKKKQIPNKQQSSDFLLNASSFILAIVILMPLCMNQVNGALVQMKDGDFCTVNMDGHCCNVQTSTKLMRLFGHVRHSL